MRSESANISIQNLPYSKQELYEIPKQISLKEKHICFMMSLSLHQIVVVRDQQKLYLLSFSKKDNKLTIADQWDMPDIIQTQKIVNNFFYVINKEHQMSIYFLTQVKDNKYSIQVVMGNLRYYSYFEHQVSKNVFELQIWFTDVNLFVYQFTTKRKVTVTEYVFIKEGQLYHHINQEKKGMVRTKCFVNSEDRFIIRKTNQKSAIYNIYPFPINTFFIVGLPGKQQYLGFTEQIQFFPMFSKMWPILKKIQIPGEENPKFTRIQVRHDMLILNIQAKNVKGVKDPVYIVNVSSNEFKILGTDEGHFKWIFGSDSCHIVGIVDSSLIRVAQIQMKFKIDTVKIHDEIQTKNMFQIKSKQTISEESSPQPNQKSYFRDQKAQQIQVDFNRNSQSKILKSLIKRNSFSPMNSSIKQESADKKIRHQVLCFNHNTLLNKKSKNQLRINYILANKNDLRSQPQSFSNLNNNNQIQKQTKVQVKSGSSLFNQFFNPNSEYIASLRQQQRQAKLFQSLEQMIMPNNQISVNGLQDLNNNKRKGKTTKKQQKQQQICSKQRSSIFGLTRHDDCIAENMFNAVDRDKVPDPKSSASNLQQSEKNNQKSLQQTIVFKPNFTDIFKTKPNDPEQKVTLYNKMHNYFQKIINNSQQVQQTQKLNFQYKSANPFLKQNNPDKQQYSLFSEIIQQAKKQKQRSKFAFKNPSIFQEKANKVQITDSITQKAQGNIIVPKYVQQQKQKINSILQDLRKNLKTTKSKLQSKMIIQKMLESQAQNFNSSRFIIQKQSLLRIISQSKDEVTLLVKKDYPKKLKNFYQIIIDQNKNYYKDAQKFFQSNIKTLITLKNPFYAQSLQNDNAVYLKDAINKFKNKIISSKNQFEQQNLDFLYQKKRQLGFLKDKLIFIRQSLQQDHKNSDYTLQFAEKTLETMRNVKQNLSFLLQQKKRKQKQKQQQKIKAKQVEIRKKQNQVLKAEKMKKKIKVRSNQAQMKSSMVVPKYSGFNQANQSSIAKERRNTKRKNSANSFAL